MRRIKSFPALLLLHLFFLPGIGMAAGNLTQNSSRECAICHFRWIDQFVEGRGTALAPLETKDVAGEEMMCLSCHDGSTEDSRQKIWLLDRHRTNMVPSDKVKIPKIFPLSQEGKMVCATCHSAHSVPTDASIERTIFLRVSSRDSEMCELCHVDQAAKQLLNHPVHSGKQPVPDKIFAAGGLPSVTDPKHLICETCHTAHGGVEKKNLVFPAGNSSLCVVCHTDKTDDRSLTGMPYKNHPIQVQLKAERTGGVKVFTGGQETIQCISCHKLHHHEAAPQAAGRANRNVDKILHFPASNSRLCTVCHPDKKSTPSAPGQKDNHPIFSKFKPETAGSLALFAGADSSMQCLSCHKIHQHEPGTMALAGKKDTLCASCHVRQNLVEGTDHDLKVTGPAASNLAKQNVWQSGVCGPCHVPHKAAGPFLWARAAGDGQETRSPSAYCLDCHVKDGPATEKNVGRFTHPVHVAVKGEPTLPLFDDPNGKPLMECGTCHDPHQWSPQHEEKGAGKNTEGDAKSSFLRKVSGTDSALCSTCHLEKYLVQSTDHDLGVTAPQEMNILGQSVGTSGVCSSCHVPHNGAAPFLWARKLGKEAKSASSLCLNCHKSGSAAEKKTTGHYSHPVSVAVAGSPSLPLVAQPDGKSFMECHTCHDPHRWDSRFNQKGAGSNEEGNEDNSFLRDTNLQKPLLCEKCHTRKGLVSGTDHDMRVTAPASVNASGKPARQGSVCAPCHAVHNASGETALWNSAMSEEGGQDFMEKACNGCHASDNAGQEKVVASGIHPKQFYFGYHKSYRNILRSLSPSTDPIPLYTKEGKKSVTGEITCPTCHDPHLWSASEESSGTEKNIEGTIVDSFLRKGARNELCYACHGMKTLLLYRFYHNAAEKKSILGVEIPVGDTEPPDSVQEQQSEDNQKTREAK
ncbi:MAG: cytochrome c3 family protein [Deltaproteobacteria bacterium]|nr:cytochrome c3 family protein [Deltaproteobacteria bacterium]